MPLFSAPFLQLISVYPAILLYLLISVYPAILLYLLISVYPAILLYLLISVYPAILLYLLISVYPAILLYLLISVYPAILLYLHHSSSLCSTSLTLSSPSYNRTGWMGIKHQVTSLLFPVAIFHSVLVWCHSVLFCLGRYRFRWPSCFQGFSSYQFAGLFSYT